MDDDATTGLWLDRASKEPLHVQVRRRLEALVLAGTWEVGHPVPSSRALAMTLGVSRGTVIAACQDLVASGLLVSRPRSGLVVAPSAGCGGRKRSPVAGRGSGQVVNTGAAPDADDAPKTTGREPDWGDLILPVGRGLGQGMTLAPDYTDYPYPFLSGQIEVRSFPARAWAQSLNAALDGPNLAASLRDGGESDDDLLVEMIRTQILPGRGISASRDEILVTNGTQQALSLIAGALLDEGRTVAFENPGYIDARHLMRATGARLVPMDVDAHGAVLAPDVECDLLYVTPSHQNPTNVTLTAARRRALLRRAAVLDAVVVEDDYDSEMRYRGVPKPSLKSLDRDGRVIYVGGFSKVLAPGLRLGYAIGPAPLVAEMRRRRALTTKHPPGLVQRAMGLFMSSGQYHRAQRDHRAQLERKWSVLGDSLERRLPWQLDERPTGGLAYWLTGPEHLDADLLTRRLRARGVLVAPGSAYFAQAEPPRHHFRVGFGAIRLADIDDGVRLIADELRGMLR